MAYFYAPTAGLSFDDPRVPPGTVERLATLPDTFHILVEFHISEPTTAQVDFLVLKVGEPVRARVIEEKSIGWRIVKAPVNGQWIMDEGGQESPHGRVENPVQQTMRIADAVQKWFRRHEGALFGAKLKPELRVHRTLLLLTHPESVRVETPAFLNVVRTRDQLIRELREFRPDTPNRLVLTEEMVKNIVRELGLTSKRSFGRLQVNPLDALDTPERLAARVRLLESELTTKARITRGILELLAPEPRPCKVQDLLDLLAPTEALLPPNPEDFGAGDDGSNNEQPPNPEPDPPNEPSVEEVAFLEAVHDALEAHGGTLTLAHLGAEMRRRLPDFTEVLARIAGGRAPGRLKRYLTRQPALRFEGASPQEAVSLARASTSDEPRPEPDEPRPEPDEPRPEPEASEPRKPMTAQAARAYLVSHIRRALEAAGGQATVAWLAGALPHKGAEFEPIVQLAAGGAKAGRWIRFLRNLAQVEGWLRVDVAPGGGTVHLLRQVADATDPSPQMHSEAEGEPPAGSDAPIAVDLVEGHERTDPPYRALFDDEDDVLGEADARQVLREAVVAFLRHMPSSCNVATLNVHLERRVQEYPRHLAAATGMSSIEGLIQFLRLHDDEFEIIGARGDWVRWRGVAT